jgi:hypothetical protein
MGFSSVVTALLMARFLFLVLQRPKTDSAGTQTVPVSCLIAVLTVLSLWGYEDYGFAPMQLIALAAAVALFAYLRMSKSSLPLLPNADIANLIPSLSFTFLRYKPIKHSMHTQRITAAAAKMITALQHPGYALVLLVYTGIALSFLYIYLY